MDKKYYLNQFKSYAYTENALLFKKYTAPVADYVATNIADIKSGSKKVSFKAEYIQLFDILAECVYNDKEGKQIYKTWQALSNTKKRDILENAIIHAHKIDRNFDRNNSVYNKNTRHFDKKAYTKCGKMSIGDLFYDVALLLSEKTIFIDC